MKQLLGITKTGKRVYDTKSVKGFTQEDLRDAMHIVTRRISEEVNALRKCQRYEVMRKMFVFVDEDVANMHIETIDKLTSLEDYLYVKFKALQNEGKSFREEIIRTF